LHGLSYRSFADRFGFNQRSVKAAVRGERKKGKITVQILKVIEKL